MEGSNGPDPNFTKNYILAESVSPSVFTSSPYINKESNFNAQSRFFNGHKDGKTSINGERKIKTSGLRNFMEELIAEYISKNTAHLIIGGRGGGLVIHYKLA